MAADDSIVVSYDDRVMTILLNRPEKLNAYAAEMRPRLIEAVREGDESDDVGCIVIKGAGRAFCTGSDLSADVKPGHKHYENAYDASIKDDIRSLQKGEGSGSAVFFGSQTPIIAQVHGWCLAGGLEIAMKCDFIVCSDDAKFGYPIVRNMASPPSHMFTYLMGTQWTRLSALHGRPHRRSDGGTGGAGLEVGAVGRPRRGGQGTGPPDRDRTAGTARRPQANL